MTVHGSLEEAAAHHGAGRGSRLGVVAGTADLAGDERSGAFAIGRLLAGQRTSHRLDGAPQGFPVG